jgi:hypothetical protein
MLIPVAAAAAEIAVPRPKGWIGTVSDWMVGLGIAFAVLGLVLLVLAWRSLRTGAGHTDGARLVARRRGARPDHGAVSLLQLRTGGLEHGARVRRVPHHDAVRARSGKRQEHDANGDALQEPLYPAGPVLHLPLGLRVRRHARGEARGPGPRLAVHDRLLHRADQDCASLSKSPLPWMPQRLAEIPELRRPPQGDDSGSVAGKTSCLDCHGPAHPDQKQAARQ